MKQIFQWIITTAMVLSMSATTVIAEETETADPQGETITEVSSEEELPGEESEETPEEESPAPEITGQDEGNEEEPAGDDSGEILEGEGEQNQDPEPGTEGTPEVEPEGSEEETPEDPEELTQDEESAEEETPEPEETPEEEEEPEEITEEEAEMLAEGEDFTPEGDTLTYVVLDAEEKTAAVTGAESGLTSITIPSTITYQGETYEVTEIAESAFENYGTIQELTFAPESNLKAIRANAFAYNLKDGSVPATISVLTLPASLEILEDGAFHCIPVEYFALEDGSNLQEIPCGFLAADGKDGYPGEETENEGFFDWLHDLIFESPSFTPAEVAKACDSLKTVDFGDHNSLTFIGMGAFKNQTHLTSIDFGQDSRAEELIIANGVFVAAGNNGAAADKGEETLGGIDTLVFPSNLKQIGYGIPRTDDAGNVVSLGDSGSFNLARVKHLVFSDNSKLEVIPEGFFEIGGTDNGYPDKVYDYETNKSTFVKDPVRIAGNSLETISFGANNRIKIIEDGAFKNQNHLKSIDFGSSDVDLTIDSGAFIGAGNNGYLYEVGVDKEINEGIVNLTFPSNLAHLNNGAFDFAKIINLTFSDNSRLTRIPDHFLGLSGHGNNGYPGEASGNTSHEGSFVKDQAQIESNSLESVRFGNNNNLSFIGNGAFYNQSHLKVIDFGTSNAESLAIGSGAFIGAGNNGYLVQNGIDKELNAGIETLVLPANLCSSTHIETYYVWNGSTGRYEQVTGPVTSDGLGTGVFDYAKIKNLVFEDNCKLDKIPNMFLGICGYGNNGYPGQTIEYGENWSDRTYGFVKDLSQIEANSLESISFGQNNHLQKINSGAFKNQSHLKYIDFGTSDENLELSTGTFIGVGNNGYLYDQGVDKELNKGIETLILPANLVSMDTGTFEQASVHNLVISDNSRLTSIPDNFLGHIGVGNNGHPGQDEDGNFVKDSAQLAANVLETIKFGENNSLTEIGNGAFRNQSHVTEIDFGSSNAEQLSISSGAFIGVGNNTYLYENGADTELNEGIETLTIPANVKNGAVPVINSSNPIRFNDLRNVTYNERTGYGNEQFLTLGDKTYEYVLIDGYGTPEEWSVADLTGKVAICSRGENSFYEKANAAVAQGAAATIVYGNSSEMMYMVLTGYTGDKPAVFISQADANNIKAESTPVKDDQGNILYYTGTLSILVNDYRTVYGLEDGAFGYAGIKNIEFEDGSEITSLQPGSFQDLDQMSNLVLGEDCALTEIGGGAFSKCDILKTVDLSDSNITNIDDAFKENPRLTSIIFPKTLESITWKELNNPEGDADGKCPFYGSNRLSELHFTNPDPNGLSFDNGVFHHLKKNGTVYVPDETTDEQLETYKNKLAYAGLNWEVKRESEKTTADEEEEVVELDREYIILDHGDSLKLSVVEPEGFKTASVVWSVESDVNKPYAEGETPIITVDEGLVTAGEADGTAYVLATITDTTGAVSYARCRVDVITKDIREDLKLLGVRLIDTKAKVNLLSTNYTPVRVQLTLRQNAFNGPKEGGEEPKEESKVQSAEFTNRTVSNIFDLEVYDDLTVKIVPKAEYVTTDAAVLKTIKGSYKSAITLVIDGKPYTSDQTLKITVNKKLPKVSVASVTLNSFIDDGQNLKIKGGTVESVKMLDNIPWLDLDSDGAETMLWFKPGTNNTNWKLKKSVKVNLAVNLEGWAVPVNTKVTVKATPTVPKLSIKTKTLTINPKTMDTGVTSWKITPAVFEDDVVTVSKITEGKTSMENTGNMVPFIANGLGAGVMNNQLFVFTNNDFDGSRARTFKVYLSIDGVEYPVTVKTMKQGTPVSMSVKAKGNINLNIPGSMVTLTVSMKNYHTEFVSYYYPIKKIVSGQAEGPDIQDQFDVKSNGNVFTLSARDGVQPGTYFATVEAYTGSQTIEKTVKFQVVSKAVPQTISLKGKGTIDVLRPGTETILTPAFKNIFEYELANITVTNKAKEDVTEKFDWEETEDDKIVISIKDGAKILHTDKYTVTATYKVNGTETTVTSKPAKLAVKQGKASVKIDKKTAEVYKKDKYSYAEVTLTVTDETVSGIDHINFVSPKSGGKEVFTWRELGNDTYAIAFNNNELPASLKYKGGKVKIQVFMKGNETTKPNATFTVKVTLK